MGRVNNSRELALIGTLIVIITTIFFISRVIGSNHFESKRSSPSIPIPAPTIDKNADDSGKLGIVAIRKINMLVGQSDAKAGTNIRKIPYIEIEFDLGKPDLGLNSMHVVRIGETDFVVFTWTKEHHGIIRIEPKDFEEIQDNSFVSYRIGSPVDKATLKRDFASGKAQAIAGVLIGRLDKKLVNQSPAIDRKPTDVF